MAVSTCHLIMYLPIEEINGNLINLLLWGIFQELSPPTLILCRIRYVQSKVNFLCIRSKIFVFIWSPPGYAMIRKDSCPVSITPIYEGKYYKNMRTQVLSQLVLKINYISY